MRGHSGKSEFIIENVVGCGPFQVLHAILVYVVTKLSTACSMMFMSYGNYNPGWRCLDGINSTGGNNTSGKGEFLKENCTLFESCKNVEFDPTTSTIVTEWGLLCDKGWIPSIIISIQMAGLLVGCFFAGHLGDAIGRKKVIYAAQAACVVLNTVAIFCTSWEMFAAVRFLLGLALACIVSLYYVYTVEFVTMKWRAPLPNIPFWSLTCIIFAVICMLLKDWRNIHIASAILSAIGFLPVIWVPESLRWLEIKNKMNKFERAVKKVAKMNNKKLPPIKDIKASSDNRNESSKTYTIFHIFNKKYRRVTILLTIPWFAMSLTFYALGFGVKALSGNFYLNLIIMYAVEIPFTILPMIAPNLLGRKLAGITFAGLSGLCLLAAAILNRVGSGDAQTTGVLVLALAGRVVQGGYWGIMMLYTVELYPTAVRALGNSWGSTMARIGGIIAPFLIPKEPETFYICYIVMGALSIVCCVIVSQLPETRGKELPDRFINESDVSPSEEIPSDNSVM